jgi:uncharacterized protein YgbK (DUF1537 family)
VIKVDSTLRGPLSALIDGALQASGLSVAVIAPAFPEQGRLLIDGRVHTNGQPGASVLDALGMAGTALISSATASESAAALEAAVEHARMRGARRIVVDADAPSCLANLARAWTGKRDWLLVGSAGLTRAVANLAGGSRPAHVGSAQQRPPISGGPVLVVAGSPAAATQAQVECLAPLARAVIAVHPQGRADKPPSQVDELLVLTSPHPDGGRDTGQASAAVARAAADSIARLRPRALVLAGGATARALFALLEVQGVRLLGEAQPGIAHGRLIGGPYAGMWVVTKAGGFGAPDALLDVVRSLGVSSAASDL